MQARSKIAHRIREWEAGAENRLYLSAAVFGLISLGAINRSLPRLNSKSVAAPINMACPDSPDVAPLDAAPSLGPRPRRSPLSNMAIFGAPRAGYVQAAPQRIAC